MMGDKLVYKLYVDGNDRSDDFIRAKPREQGNKFSVVNITLQNEDGKYSTGIIGGDSTVKLQGSTDGGNNYQTLFTGTAKNVMSEISPAGEEYISIRARGSEWADGYYLSPNQIILGPNDLGHIYTGTANDYGGESWSQDSDGNYPNGLLYKTGYEYSTDSIGSIFASVTDIPQAHKFNQKRIFEAMRWFSHNYGLLFFLDDENKEVIVKQDAYYSDFPTHSFTLSYGENINRSSIESDVQDKYDGVGVIGGNSNIFFLKGDGPNYYIEKDESIDRRLTTMRRSELLDTIKTVEHFKGRVTAPPITESILGKKITINDSQRDMTRVGNVVGVSHNISPERWSTEIELESDNSTIPQTLAEIRESMEDEETSARGQVYLKMEGYPNSNYASTTRNILAYGIGTDTSTGSFELQSAEFTALIDTQIIDEDDSTRYAWGKFGGMRGSGRLREITAIGGEEIIRTKSFTASVQRNIITNVNGIESNWVKLADFQESFPITIKYCGEMRRSIPYNGMDRVTASMNMNPGKASRILYLANDNYYFGGSVSVAATGLPNPTATVWEGADEVGADAKQAMIRDEVQYSNSTLTNSSVATIPGNDPSTVSDGTAIFTIFEFETDISEDVSHAIIEYTEHMQYLEFPQGYAKTNVFFWDDLNEKWADLSSLSTGTGFEYPLYSDSSTPPHPNNVTNEVVGLGSMNHMTDDKGIFRIGHWTVCPSTSAGAQVSHNIYHYAPGIKVLEPLLQTRKPVSISCEKAKFNPRDNSIELDKELIRLDGVYLSYSLDSNERTGEGENLVNYVTPKREEGRPLEVNSDGVFFRFKTSVKNPDQSPFNAFPEIEYGQYLGEEEVTLSQPLWEVLTEQEDVYVNYLAYDNKQHTLEEPYQIPNKNLQIEYDDATHKSGSLYMDVKQGPGLYGLDIDFEYTCLPDAQTIGRWIAETGRIDQGIYMDSRADYNLLFAIDTSSITPVIGNMHGLGCAGYIDNTGVGYAVIGSYKVG